MLQKKCRVAENLRSDIWKRIIEKLKSVNSPLLVLPPGGQIWDINDLKDDSKSLENAQKICDYDDLKKELEAVRNILQETLVLKNQLIKENEQLKQTIQLLKDLSQKSESV